MIWEPDEIDWLALDATQRKAALAELLNSNPVVNARLIRPTLHAASRDLFNGVYESADDELSRAMKNKHAYPTSQLIHEVIVDGINKFLMVLHYQFMLRSCRPRPSHCPVSEGQIWFPASYFLVRATWELLNVPEFQTRVLTGPVARRTTVFNWERGEPQIEFYDGPSARHPAVVTAVRADGFYWIAPITHSTRGGGIRIDVGSRSKKPQYAKDSFPVLASWAMLYGDRRATNNEGLRVKSIDFALIQQKAARHWK